MTACCVPWRSNLPQAARLDASLPCQRRALPACMRPSPLPRSGAFTVYGLIASNSSGAQGLEQSIHERANCSGPPFDSAAFSQNYQSGALGCIFANSEGAPPSASPRAGQGRPLPPSLLARGALRTRHATHACIACHGARPQLSPAHGAPLPPCSCTLHARCSQPVRAALTRPAGAGANQDLWADLWELNGRCTGLPREHAAGRRGPACSARQHLGMQLQSLGGEQFGVCRPLLRPHLTRRPRSPAAARCCSRHVL